jgi:hypothetical protein
MSKLRVGMWGTTAFRPSIVWDFLKFLLGEGGSVLPWHVQNVSLPTGQPDDDVAIQDIVALSPPWIGNMGVHGAATDVSCAAGCSSGGQIPQKIEHLEGVIYEFDGRTAGHVTPGGLSQWGVGMRVESEIHAACCRFDLDQFGLICRDIADMAMNSTVPDRAQTLTICPSALTVWAIASHNLGQPVSTHELSVPLAHPHPRPPRAPLPVS